MAIGVKLRTVGLAILFASPTFATDLLIFGGQNHDEFLGCWNCGEYSSDSVCNEYGDFGSEYASNSIFNEYGNYGSEYSSSSPWNEYSSSDEVPILVDRQGGFYGYLTINTYRSDSVSFASDLANLYAQVDGNLDVLRNSICE